MYTHRISIIVTVKSTARAVPALQQMMLSWIADALLHELGFCNQDRRYCTSMVCTHVARCALAAPGGKWFSAVAAAVLHGIHAMLHMRDLALACKLCIMFCSVHSLFSGLMAMSSPCCGSFLRK